MPHKDYSLKSGERQFAGNLKDIRSDHRQRYEFGLTHLTKPSFGIDVFCGNGYGTNMLCNAGHKVFSIDGSADAIECANNFYSTPNSFFVHKLWPFNLPIDTFDFAFCLESIEHVEDWSGLLDALMMSLRSGGLLVLSTPNEDLMPFIESQHKYHFRHFSQEETFSMVRERGFEILEWGGQVVYDISEIGVHKIVDGGEAPVFPNESGQFTTVIARKN